MVKDASLAKRAMLSHAKIFGRKGNRGTLASQILQGMGFFKKNAN